MKRAGKGYFGRWQLPTSGDYVTLRRQNQLLIWGCLLALGATVVLVVNFLFFSASALSAGELSNPHAVTEDNCQACHVSGATISDERCNDCHEKLGDRESYSFGRHYVYRFNPPGETRTVALQVSCSSCHSEHRGREENIAWVSDSRCVNCHPVGSFNRSHPPFDFSETSIEEPGIKFSHIFHSNKIKTEYQVGDTEQTCLFCHTPDSEGRHFEPLSFDLHCASCHLKPPLQVGPLAVSDRETGDTSVALSLAGFRGLATPPAWTAVADAGQFSRPASGTIVKAILEHRDSWVLENLRRVRRSTRPDPTSRSELEELYRRAIQELRNYASSLSQMPDPEVIGELSRIQGRLGSIDRELSSRPPPSPQGPGEITSGDTGDTALEPAQRELVASLTEPCQLCHMVSGAALAPVQNQQRVLRRAQFNHQSHLAAVSCTDCHDRIPLSRGIDVAGVTSGRELASQLDIRQISRDEFAKALEIPGPALFRMLGDDKAFTAPLTANVQQLLLTWSRETEADRAAIQNIPGIETCRECHQPGKAPADCVNCHYFHPEKGLHPGRTFLMR